MWKKHTSIMRQLQNETSDHYLIAILVEAVLRAVMLEEGISPYDVANFTRQLMANYAQGTRRMSMRKRLSRSTSTTVSGL